MQFARPQKTRKDFVCHVNVFAEPYGYALLVSRGFTLDCTIMAGQVPGVLLEHLLERFPGCFNDDGRLTVAGEEKFSLST